MVFGFREYPLFLTFSQKKKGHKMIKDSVFYRKQNHKLTMELL